MLKQDLLSYPAVIYEKRAELLCNLLEGRVSKASIYRTVRRLAYTREKVRRVSQKGTNGLEGLGGRR